VPTHRVDAPAEPVWFDVPAVTTWILGLGIGARAPLAFSRTAGGYSNLTFEIRDAAGARWILRRPPLGHLLASAHDVGREHYVLARLSGTDVPAPAVLGLCVDLAASDAPLLLMDYVDGVVIDEPTADTLEPARRHAVGMALPGVLARLHAVDIDATGLSDFASHKPYAVRQLKRWRRQWAGSRTRELPAIDELATRLERAAPEQTEVCVVHGDYHLLNLIFDAREPVVRAIIDWELCTLGDPLADLGGLLAYWPEPGETLGVGALGVSARPGFPTRRELAEGYAAASGRDLTALPFWEALACWKIAVIGEGIVRRQLDEPANAGADDAPFETATVDRLLERALRIADEAGI